MKVSIIIPCKSIDKYTEECVDRCLEIDYPNYDIVVLPDNDENNNTQRKNVHVISTGSVKPLKKRFMAVTACDGDVYAFIDSDAFPTRDWLRNAVNHFDDPDVAAVVGPSLTPEEDNFMAKASGFILASPFGGGSESIRYDKSHQHIQNVSEAPTCNMIIRKSILEAAKDLVPDVWPGEEIIFCGVIVNDLKKKIIYDPTVVVYHHRRSLFISHLRQIWNYAEVKGCLLKEYPRYVRPIFFFPSLLVIGIAGGMLLAMLNSAIMQIYIVLVFTYFILLLGNGALIGLRRKSLRIAFLVFVGSIATHVCYGLAFIKGIFSRKLE